MTLQELADGINRHLKRLEAGTTGLGLHNAGAYYMGGARIRVTYRSHEGGTTLTRPKAEAYLTWLDQGNVGRHTEHVKANQAATTRALDGRA